MSAYFELRHRQPRLQKLRNLLEKSSYRGPINEKEMDKNGLDRVSIINLTTKCFTKQGNNVLRNLL